MENRVVKILAIDDNKDNLTILRALIMESFPKAIVLTALSGQVGLALADKEEPDVILLDIIMPVMDGYETCQRLKADKKLGDIQVVFVTALKSDKASRIKALEAGADAFLTKPIDESELTAQIRAMLKIREANIEKRDDRDRLAILLEEKTRELVKSEAKYRQIAENVIDVVWMADMDMRTIYISPSVEKMLGESTEAHMRKTLKDRLTQASLEKMQQVVLEELEIEKDLRSDKNRSRIIEVEHYRADGSVIWVSMHTSYLRDENGKAIGFQGVSRDVTERKQIEGALRKSEERFRVAQEISPDGFSILRPVRNKAGEIIDFTFVYENQAVARLNQTDPQKVIGKSLLTLFPAHSGTRIFEAYVHVANTGGTQILDEISVGEIVSSPKWLRLVVISMGEEIAIIAQDITESKRTENELLRFAEELEQQRKDLEKRLLQSVNAISRIGEIRDAYTAGHQREVAELACAIGRDMGLVAEQIHNLSFGALIHDIGKFFIPSEILNKPGRISALEYQMLQTHVEESYNIVKEIDFPEEVHTMIYQHHERLDGSGYPQGLSGDEIILQSRILAVADVVEAMTSHRPYRAALGIDAALEEIVLHRGTKYDAEVVDICVRLFKDNGFAL